MKQMRLLPLLSILLLVLSCDQLKELEAKFSTPKESPSWTSEVPNEKGDSVKTTVPWKGEAVAADTFIKIAKLADPAVVNIGTTKIVKRQRMPRGFGQQGPFGDFFGDDLFRKFFGEENPDQPEQKQQSLGSGFVMSEDGYIATNNHVVEKADEIRVTIGKNHEYKAKLVGADPKTDLALLKIEPTEKLKTMALGDSDQLQVGEIVVAIGNPFGLSHTVTQGIVSAKERSIGFGTYDNFIQTDASINPGNSGGPLINLRTEVVGINSAIIASGQGLGFAIPINLAKNVLQQLRDKGSVTRGWLGVYIQKVDPDLAKSLGIKESRGALVSQVQPGSPADKVGIKQGDVIVKVGSKEIDEYNDLPRLVASMTIGSKVSIDLIRGGKKVTVEPVIKELKQKDGPEGEEGSSGEKEDESAPSAEDKLGLSVQNLTPDIAKQVGVELGTRGVVVSQANSSGAAASKGIQQGDVITEVNKTKVSNVDDYRKYTKSLKKGSTVLLLVKRGPGTSLFVAFTL